MECILLGLGWLQVKVGCSALQKPHLGGLGVAREEGIMGLTP